VASAALIFVQVIISPFCLKTACGREWTFVGLTFQGTEWNNVSWKWRLVCWREKLLLRLLIYTWWHPFLPYTRPIDISQTRQWDFLCQSSVLLLCPVEWTRRRLALARRSFATCWPQLWTLARVRRAHRSASLTAGPSRANRLAAPQAAGCPHSLTHPASSF